MGGTSHKHHGLYQTHQLPAKGLDHHSSICITHRPEQLTHGLLKRLETYSIPTHLLLIGVPPFIGTALLRHTLSPSQAALISVFAFSMTLLISTALYRLSPFHPLAKYRGPLSCKLTKFWLACLSLGGRQHLYIKSLHERYGDVVRIGPNELSFRDPSVLTGMLGVGRIPKGPHIAGRVLSTTDLPLPGIMDPEMHSERWKPWARAFSASALREYEPTIARRANQLIQVLEKQEQEVMIGKFFNYFAYDFMCDMVFGGGSELLRDGDKDNVWHLIEDALLLSTPRSITRSLPPTTASHRCHRRPSSLVLKDIVALHSPDHQNNDDQPDKPHPPIQQLLDDGVLAVVAGSDTTSSALTSLVFCLLSHPNAMKRLQAEVDEYYPAGENACYLKHHREMHYLTAVINETLRLYPPVPTGTQRRVPHRSQGVMLET
ncbi:hypothetical protein NUW54_g7834 [Trametes sanguinea]|uniref:Uncharacterized protein n=1 Tax=Trametes sanguinea TaxID=158606 RepID=A0ACC1PI41_9APHY|nr:hypothetical protein NUW54_g7834 [Trametes sanguinea]